MENKNLSFSAEVAETLGIESAIILDLYKQNKLDDISSYEDLINSILKHISFIEISIIKSSLDKLIKFDLIKMTDSKIEKKYKVKSPGVNQETNKLNKDWAPSPETKEIINMGEIPDEFCDLKLKEFKIYWIERGQKKNNWNMTFIDFIRREWAKESNSKKTLPHTIDEKWFPDDDVFDILNLSEITKDSALRYLREFILYWKDKGAAFTTWNSKFIDHVKRRHMMNDNIGINEKDKKYIEPGQYSKDFNSRKNDTTWANEINLD